MPDPTEQSGPRFGPFRLDSKISLTNVLAFTMAFVAMVGGWYKFDYRQTSTEQNISAIQQTLQKHEANDQRLADTLERTNRIMGATIQALDDHNIHVRINGGGYYPEAEADSSGEHK